MWDITERKKKQLGLLSLGFAGIHRERAAGTHVQEQSPSVAEGCPDTENTDWWETGSNTAEREGVEYSACVRISV